MTITGYHYSNDIFQTGQEFLPQHDHFDSLDPSQREAELAIRQGKLGAAEIRIGAVYVWRDEDWARAAYRLSKRKYLYEVEVEERDILHQADLSHYTDTRDAINGGRSPNEHVRRYWAGEPHLPEHIKPRFEILARKVIFRSRLAP